MNEAEINEFLEGLKQEVKAEGVEIKSQETKLNQRLAYPIKRQRAGHFVRLSVETNEPADLNRHMSDHVRANEKVMRQFVITAEPRVELPVTESVLGEMRRQERVERKAGRAETPFRSPVSSVEPEPKPPADIEEIDKKIEELLK